MTYIPGTWDGGPLEAYVQDQFQRISEVLQPVVDGEMFERHVLPDMPRSGLYLADGTNWDPGSGAGLYRYDEGLSAFVAIETAAGVTDHTALTSIGTNTHAQIDTHLALVNPHLDWAADQGTTNIHAGNYINTTYVNGDWDHNALTNYVANRHVLPKNSLQIDVGEMQLDGDAAAPGNDQYYGTSGAGAKGWFTFPTAGSEINDLTAAVVWATIPIGNVPTGTSAVTVAFGNHLHTGVYAPNVHTHPYTDIVSVQTNKLLGRTTAATGAAELIAVGQALSMTAGSLQVDLGPAAGQAAAGNHLHTGVYEPVDATIVRTGDAAWNATDWDTAFGWGNHAGLYSLLAHQHTAYDRATSVLSGANVFSNIVVTNGIVTSIATRALTPANIGAAATSHNHTAAETTSGTFLNARISAASVTQHLAKYLRHISTGYNDGEITVGLSAPGSPTQGDVWFDTGSGGVNEANNLTAAVVWANVPNANITQGSVTQHQAALTIIESQITSAAFTNWNTAFGWGNHSGLYSLLAHQHTAYDRASSVLSGANVFSNLVITNGIVTSTATRALTAANIGAAPTTHNHTAAQTTSGTFADARIAVGNVTQHQASLGAAASTISTLVRRDASGDINVRLVRSEYDTTNATIGRIMTQIDTISNNYIRPSTPAQIVAALDDVTAWNFTGAQKPRMDNLGIPYYVTATYVGGKITVAASAPGSPAKGDIWFDTT